MWFQKARPASLPMQTGPSARGERTGRGSSPLSSLAPGADLPRCAMTVKAARSVMNDLESAPLRPIHIA